MIRNKTELAEAVGIEEHQMIRAFSKYSGVSLTFTVTGVKIHSIVEGWDGDGLGVSLGWGFTKKDWDSELDRLDKATTAIWEWVNEVEEEEDDGTDETIAGICWDYEQGRDGFIRPFGEMKFEMAEEFDVFGGAWHVVSINQGGFAAVIKIEAEEDLARRIAEKLEKEFTITLKEKEATE